MAEIAPPRERCRKVLCPQGVCTTNAGGDEEGKIEATYKKDKMGFSQSVSIHQTTCSHDSFFSLLGKDFEWKNGSLTVGRL